jgi:cholesterol transport system auxiliary component
MRSWAIQRLASAGAALLTVSCALLTKDAPIVPRYFSPDSYAPSQDVQAPPTTSQELRLGRVNASAYIRDQLVHRDSLHEVGSYEEIRWTEKPESYVRHALEQAIFARRGVHQVVSGGAMTLEVDVVAFEEVRGPPHVGRIRLDYKILDDRLVRAARSVVIERPIAPASGAAAADAMVSALAVALNDAVEVVAKATLAEAADDGAAAVTGRGAGPP